MIQPGKEHLFYKTKTFEKPVLDPLDKKRFIFTERVGESSDYLTDTIYEYVKNTLAQSGIDFTLLDRALGIQQRGRIYHGLIEKGFPGDPVFAPEISIVEDGPIYCSKYRKLTLLHYIISELVKNSIDDFAEKRLCSGESLKIKVVIKSDAEGHIWLKLSDNSSMYPHHAKSQPFNLKEARWQKSAKKLSTHQGGKGVGLLGCQLSMDEGAFKLKNRKDIGLSGYICVGQDRRFALSFATKRPLLVQREGEREALPMVASGPDESGQRHYLSPPPKRRFT